MDHFYHYLANPIGSDDDGALLFLAYTLNPDNARAAALRFCSNHLALPESPTSALLLDVAMGLYVLRALDIRDVQHGRRAFSLAQLTQEVDAAFATFAWSEVFGFAAVEDDEDLCDAVVWLYVFEHAGLRAFASVQPRVHQTLEQRRLVYGHPEDARAWQWTSYLVTHVVYLKSDWGLQAPSELCDGEFRYIVDNLPRALVLEDVELVGEFVHCLRVLGCTLSPAQQAVVQQGRALLARPHVALWRSRASFYTKFHTAWCIAVGLA